MNKEVLFTLLRAVLTFVGTYLVGKPLLGGTVDENLVQVIIGTGMSLASLAWSVFDKTLGLEMIQAFLRSLATGFGGFLMANGVIKPDQLETYLALALALATFVHSIVGKKKSAGISSGTIPIDTLKTT